MKSVAFAAVLSAALALPAVADDKHRKNPSAAQGSAQSASLAEGEIRKVDRDAKKITIRHGPLPSLDMPAMTMVFQVGDAAMLDQVKAGDKVRFEAEKVGGAFRITRLEPVK